MRNLYLAAGVILFIEILISPSFLPSVTLMGTAVDPGGTLGVSIVDAIAQESEVPNTVSGIIFRNRLYDTIFEVVVFTLAIMGVRFLLSDEQPASNIRQFTDYPSIVLAKLGATIAALIAVELAIRGHLSPGGGFAAGVAGGTAIGLVVIVSDAKLMETLYQRWRASTLEKVSVLIFIVFSALSLSGVMAPDLVPKGTLLYGGWIPVLNILVAVKVALGSWSAVLLFIRYRGLL
ncbi:Na+/H+ antiporter family domain protein [Synechococcus sp. PCC 7335]|uniref:Na(+)/H(+) antiporter subunit B n=1 Tax=Synechococcus sp. (strain ATCC 29403 / PCC 7335) TaxID=91464 RepID=UPI00017EE477|nr:Na(+)/H(+) antiporter subunit B [Synechococcus sp. PCC 7335]EDX87174.1 Na+/H+ antiporter family domain protein [Synechococcus sp. PCC 7335]